MKLDPFTLALVPLTLPASRLEPLLAGLLLTLYIAPLRAADPFEEMVRSTPWLSPADARKAFSLPDGFEIQLVASEPDIAKPISMSFDVDGRLWVAETKSYPIEVARDKTPRDSLRILSDFRPDGHAGKNQIFADGLSTPDAVAPYKNGAIIFSIPNVVNLQDTDSDGKADRREVLFGPFNARDTHNLANNFRRGFDGWFYGGQGVGNPSAVQGTDGHQVKMSGATFRFRADGSRIERVGDGQANVFGLCFDPLGNLFTSDCHSMPIYQVIYGGFYPVFGKPHDGLGYAPQMLWHNHGSTAIAGLIDCEEPLWPEEFQGNFLLGNVVTSRVNRDRIEERGSTKIAHEMPDFVRTSDPWFRPVDVQFGPDGALYIADFYNRIIAHVEVPLDHPGRDPLSGRIWRVVRRGSDGKPMLRHRKDFQTLTLKEKIGRLSDPSFAHRLTVLNALVDQGGGDIIAEVRRAAQNPTADPHLKASSLWILERLGALGAAELSLAAKDGNRLVRTHAVRIVVERSVWSPADRQLVLAALQDADGFVARAAADALARHPTLDPIDPLLALLRRTSTEDTHLIYQTRKAIRDQLLIAENLERLGRDPLPDDDARVVAEIVLGVPSPSAAAYLIQYLQSHPVEKSPLLEWTRHIARHGTSTQLDSLIPSLQTHLDRDLDLLADLFLSIQLGLEQRGIANSESMKAWGSDVATRLMKDFAARSPGQIRIAADLAIKLHLTHLENSLAAVVATPASGSDARTSCLRALLTLNPSAYLDAAAAFLNDAQVSAERRVEIVQTLGQLNSPASRNLLVTVLRQAPDRLGLRLAAALSGSAEGADALLQAVIEGHAPAPLLADRTVKDRLLAVRPNESNRIAQLIAALPPDSERLQKIAADRAASILKNGASADATTGAQVFQLNCSVCHSLAGVGGTVGPQLDGIGHRGLERLCEDVLNPNRNVDKIFRYSIVTLKDGDVMTGLFRREEGALMVLVDATGKEFRVAKSDVTERKESETSLMPENFAEVLAPADFQNLMAFLLSRRGDKPH